MEIKALGKIFLAEQISKRDHNASFQILELYLLVKKSKSYKMYRFFFPFIILVLHPNLHWKSNVLYREDQYFLQGS